MTDETNQAKPPSQAAGEPADSLLPKHGGYRHLKSFQVAQLAYDVTVRFCDRYIDRRSRTHDQMVQAARSGVQNRCMSKTWGRLEKLRGGPPIPSTYPEGAGRGLRVRRRLHREAVSHPPREKAQQMSQTFTQTVVTLGGRACPAALGGVLRFSRFSRELQTLDTKKIINEEAV